jgi:hypothetical protein
MTEDPTTQELRIAQIKREQAERKAAEDTGEITGEDTGQHEARASKAAYLREKLEQRAAAERRAARSKSKR